MNPFPPSLPLSLPLDVRFYFTTAHPNGPFFLSLATTTKDPDLSNNSRKMELDLAAGRQYILHPSSPCTSQIYVQAGQMPLVLPLGPQDTDQASSSVLSIHVCEAAISLQQSSRVVPNREKQTQGKLSGSAPLEYTEAACCHMSSGWTPLAGSSCRRPH